MNISILMSVYYKENASYFEQCLLSLKKQTVQAHEIIIVEDGELTSDLYSILDLWQQKLPIKRIKLPVNSGLGVSLNIGIKHCSNDLVARMDTDDVCHPMRLEKQIKIFKVNDIDICGTWVSEFEALPDNIRSYRKTPSDHYSIVELSKKKNPINHPSVMYKKSTILAVGSYDNVLFFEDYHLWLKLIKSGAKFYNIPESLVNMRAGISQLSRRGGSQYAIREFQFLKRSRDERLLSDFDFLFSVVIRIPLRLLPRNVLALIYRMIRK